MVDELTIEQARDAHWKGGPDRTPRYWAWERRIYERVVFPFWPLLLAGLRPVRPDGRYSGLDVMRRFPAAIEALADRTSPEDQEAFLAAMDSLFQEEIGPVEPGCRCGYCRPARRWQRKEAEVPRVVRLRRAFVRECADHLEVVVKAPNAYDRHHGAPRLIGRRGRRPAPGRI